MWSPPSIGQVGTTAVDITEGMVNLDALSSLSPVVHALAKANVKARRLHPHLKKAMAEEVAKGTLAKTGGRLALVLARMMGKLCKGCCRTCRGTQRRARRP
eukprot:5541704-Lingulodinium_polyedra.AAC.1